MRQCNILFTLVVGLLYAVPQAFASPEAATPVTGPHIAVLLPLKSKTLGPAAQAVKSGIEAAAALNPQETGRPSLPVSVYTIGEQDSEVLAAYEMAQDNQAQVIIGPLGRSATTQLAKSANITVPTIALSEVESTLIPTGPWYTLTLSVEQEARQVAQLAFQKGGRTAMTIQTGSALEQRIQATFAHEWEQLGGKISSSLTLKPSKEELKSLRASIKADNKPDLIFLATDSKNSKQIRPWLDTSINTYATSQAYDGQRTQPGNMDLIRLRFVDAPWLIQPDFFTALGYTRPTTSMRADLARLYGLGIDSWRLAQWLAVGPLKSNFEMDGVIGQLKLGNWGVIQRTPLAAEIGEESPVVLQ